MDKITAELKIKQALTFRLPPATKYYLHPVQKVRLYREQSSKWEGPFTVQIIIYKESWLTDGQKTKHFNLSQIIPDPADVTDRDLSRLLSRFK